LSVVLAALRKLREGIVASKRADDFAAQAYLFNIRVAVLARQPEHYHPALLHLLRRIHARHPLTHLEHAEAVRYLVLDTACRRGAYNEAVALKRRHGVRSALVEGVLAALWSDNWVAFRKLKGTADTPVAKIMEYAEAEMRMHTLKCFGRAYLSVDMEFLEKSTGRTFEELKSNDGVGWELDGKKVVIRKIQAKT
jgi:hypothetical protein